MKKIKLACLASVLAAGVAQAGTPCNGFEIKIKNDLANDNLIIRSIHMEGAEFQPSGIQQIDANSEAVFTVNNSADGAAIKGEMTLITISLPSKEVKIQFDLKNKTLTCKHTDFPQQGDLSVNHHRLPGKVDYTINYK